MCIFCCCRRHAIWKSPRLSNTIPLVLQLQPVEGPQQKHHGRHWHYRRHRLRCNHCLRASVQRLVWHSPNPFPVLVPAIYLLVVDIRCRRRAKVPSSRHAKRTARRFQIKERSVEHVTSVDETPFFGQSQRAVERGRIVGHGKEEPASLSTVGTAGSVSAVASDLVPR